MEFRIFLKSDAQSIKTAQSIRHDIFVLEQNIPSDLEIDGLDNNSYHCLAFLDTKPVGTLRLTRVSNNHAIMARVAVVKDFRSRQIASKMISHTIKNAKQLGIKSIEIHPHEYLENFYSGFGFKYLDTFPDAGEHKLIKMETQI